MSVARKRAMALVIRNKGEQIMSKKNIATLALAAALSAATVIPTTTPAEARDGRHYRGHHAHNHGHHRHHRHHRGRGYWKDGKWIALGIIGAAAAAAIANSDRDCYYRHGRRYCNY